MAPKRPPRAPIQPGGRSGAPLTVCARVCFPLTVLAAFGAAAVLAALGRAADAAQLALVGGLGVALAHASKHAPRTTTTRLLLAWELLVAVDLASVAASSPRAPLPPPPPPIIDVVAPPSLDELLSVEHAHGHARARR